MRALLYFLSDVWFKHGLFTHDKHILHKQLQVTQKKMLI